MSWPYLPVLPWFILLLASSAGAQRGVGYCEVGEAGCLKNVADASSFLHLNQARVNTTTDAQAGYVSGDKDGRCNIYYGTDVIIEDQYQDEGYLLQRYFSREGVGGVNGDIAEGLTGCCFHNTTGASFTTDPSRKCNCAAVWRFYNPDDMWGADAQYQESGGYTDEGEARGVEGPPPLKYGDQFLIINQYVEDRFYDGVPASGWWIVRYSGPKVVRFDFKRVSNKAALWTIADENGGGSRDGQTVDCQKDVTIRNQHGSQQYLARYEDPVLYDPPDAIPGGINNRAALWKIKPTSSSSEECACGT